MSTASPIISVSNLTGNTKSERYVQAINDFLQGILYKIIVFNFQYICHMILLHNNVKWQKRKYLKHSLFYIEYDKNRSNYDLDCQKKHSISGHPRKSCYFNIHNLGICSTPPYGYTKPLKPCVLIKFNKVISLIWILIIVK